MQVGQRQTGGTKPAPLGAGRRDLVARVTRLIVVGRMTATGVARSTAKPVTTLCGPTKVTQAPGKVAHVSAGGARTR